MTITINGKEIEVSSSKEAIKAIKKAEKEEIARDKKERRDRELAGVACMAVYGKIAQRAQGEYDGCTKYQIENIERESLAASFSFCPYYSNFMTDRLDNFTCNEDYSRFTKMLQLRSGKTLALFNSHLNKWFAVGTCNDQMDACEINFDINHIIN